MTVLVYGMGRSGRAAVELARRQGHAVLAFDRAPSPRDLAAVAAAGATMTDAPAGAETDVCIAAPGVPIDHPDLAALRARGIEVIGEVEWVYRTVPATYLGVTGTAGKGTVTRWLCDVLTEDGIPAEVGGNFDPALAAVAQPGGTYVVEMSSFQLERVAGFQPRVAVVLNLGEDHLDRHHTVAAYHRAKRALLEHLGPADTLVFNADDPILRSWAGQSRARVRGFSVAGKSDAYLQDGVLYMDGDPLVAQTSLGVIGIHQVANGLAVALAADAMGVEIEALRNGLAAFTGLPGRHAVVADRDGIRFIDDSIATRELAVRAALLAAEPPIVWIIGGQDKGARPERLAEIVRERVDLIIGIGACGAKYAAALSDAAPHVLCGGSDGVATMRCAVETATAHLQGRRAGRGTVLLAPLASSFDQFEDYAHRSRAFRQAVAEGASWTASS